MKFGRPALVALLGALVATAACGARSTVKLDSRGDAGDVRAKDYSTLLLDQTPFRKVDLLFVIDNSISMMDKQRLFAEAIPVLLRRLVTPLCIDADGNPTGEFSPCPAGAEEFASLDDIHIGIITSSLGHHGADVCVPDPGETLARQLDDRAQLLGSMRAGLYSYEGAGFLVWDPRDPRPIPDPHPSVSDHETQPEALLADFASYIRAVGERGCGYEATLEAWYRFLVDPEPVSAMANDGAASMRGPTNQIVLDQRARFLRPESLLAIVMLTDENDCSIIDEEGGLGWLVSRRVPMSRASSECDGSGDDAARCCRPCAVELEGCPPNARDSECQKGVTLESLEDSTNLRCFQQSRRFGVDLLYPTRRYVDGLTRRYIAPRSLGPDAPLDEENGIFAPGPDGRSAPEGRAFLIGILGVPWQDIAERGSLDGRELTYLDARDFGNVVPNRWDVILGDPNERRAPLDPFMVESVETRTGANPITDDSIIQPSSSLEPNAINGHEQAIINRDDLQYACTFELPESVPCTMENQDGCDCNASEIRYQRPICEYRNEVEDGIQTHGKAYPGLRQLEVLRGVADRAVVASICPKNTVAEGDPASDPAYGYNPAVAAMIQRFKSYLARRCLFRRLPLDESGRVPCSLIEVDLLPARGCSCDPAAGRFDVDEINPLYSVIPAKLQDFGWCGESTPVACDDYCVCEVNQFAGTELETCRTSPFDPGGLQGFCYVDEATSNPELVRACQPGERYDLRYLGTPGPTPPKFSILFCPIE